MKIEVISDAPPPKTFTPFAIKISFQSKEDVDKWMEGCKNVEKFEGIAGNEGGYCYPQNKVSAIIKKQNY